MLETFGEYASPWLDEAFHLLRATTREKYAQHLRTDLLPVFGDRPLDAVKPSHVKSWVAALGQTGAAPGTVKTVFQA